jgi:Ras-related protein Rab-5C
VQELQRQANARLVIALVGNKTDLEETLREIPKQEAEAYATENELIYIETSARLGTNVCHVFTEIGNYWLYT